MAVYQRVTSEDIFLGMSTKDPGTTSADGLRLTIKLPKENNVKDIELDVRPEEVNFLTITYTVLLSKYKVTWKSIQSFYGAK